MLRSTPCPPKWKSDDLYLFLCEAFPEHRTPFNRLDVNRLAGDIGKSYESLYQKLRKGRLNVEWAKLLCEFANDEDRLVQSARTHAQALIDVASEGYAGPLQIPDDAEALVRQRFVGDRQPLTIEQDFMRFFI